jgi:hypothetical protein
VRATRAALTQLPTAPEELVPIKKAPPNDGAKTIVRRGSATSPTRSRSSAKASELRRRCFLFTTLLKDRRRFRLPRQRFLVIPAASSLRMRPFRPRDSRHSRGWASGPHDVPNAKVHIHGVPTGEAAALKMRPTRTPSASTSKSSSFHSPEGRKAEARLRVR